MRKQIDVLEDQNSSIQKALIERESRIGQLQGQMVTVQDQHSKKIETIKAEYQVCCILHWPSPRRGSWASDTIILRTFSCCLGSNI